MCLVKFAFPMFSDDDDMPVRGGLEGELTASKFVL